MLSSKKNYLIDLLAFLALLISFLSGLLLWFILPAGPRFYGGKNMSETLRQSFHFLGLSRHSWKMLHIYSSLIFVFLILLHLLMHRKWVSSMSKAFFCRKPKK